MQMKTENPWKCSKNITPPLATHFHVLNFTCISSLPALRVEPTFSATFSLSVAFVLYIVIACLLQATY
jgi:hypothetical protein